MISKLAHVDPSAKIADGVTIHAFAYIDKNVEIGPGCEIMPYASIIRGTRMGSNNKVYQGAIVGADPQDFRWKGEETYCYIGNNNVIREQVIINRGITSEGGTRIGDDCFIMAESHVGHDTHIKGRCVLGNGVTVAGDAEIGECVILSSNAIVHERCRIGRYALVKGGCRIGSYYGINAYIMRRENRFSEQLVDDAAKAYRHIYQCGTSVYNALKRIEADIDPSELRDDILNFIRDNNMRIVGDTHNEY